MGRVMARQPPINLSYRLLTAAARGNLDRVEHIIEQANEFDVNLDLESALYIANERGHLPIVNFCSRRRIFWQARSNRKMKS